MSKRLTRRREINPIIKCDNIQIYSIRIVKNLTNMFLYRTIVFDIEPHVKKCLRPFISKDLRHFLRYLTLYGVKYLKQRL